MTEISLSLPSNVLGDREQFLFFMQTGQVLIAMTAFSLMAAAETSHNFHYHYSFYSSLTFFVWVGVAGFLFGIFLVASKFYTIMNSELRSSIELYGTGILLWATYTAAIAASATSTSLHTIFDQDEGSWCAPRHHSGRLMAGAYFCSRLVSAIVMMYILVATYAASLYSLLQEADPTSRGYTRTVTGSTHGGYDDIGETVAMTQLSSSSPLTDSP